MSLARSIIRSVFIISCALFLYSSLLWLLVSYCPTLEQETAVTDEHGNVLAKQMHRKLQFPTTITELQELLAVLRLYHDSHFIYILTLFSAAYIFKQTFAIPGSALMNILGGALLGVWVALPVVCVLTSVGASCCYLLSRVSLAGLLMRYQPERVLWLRSKVVGSSSSNFLFLVSLRVFPGTPNWFLNMAAPVAGVPLVPFFFSVLIGLAPYNSLCVLAGGSATQLRSVTDLWSGTSLAALLLLALLAYVGSRVAARYAAQHQPQVKYE
uniref:Transmembrane protein 41A-like n=2 Tax=Hirondellea gigas TaxID=1518452 RepID=A0A2P2I9T1_9CRUS